MTDQYLNAAIEWHDPVDILKAQLAQVRSTLVFDMDAIRNGEARLEVYRTAATHALKRIADLEAAITLLEVAKAGRE